MDGRAVVNAAVYHSNWEGIPVNVIGTCGLASVDNAGKAEVQGLEMESTVFLTSALRLELAVAHIKAELAEDAAGIGGLDGDRLPGSPENSASLGLMYDFTIKGRSGYVRADYAYVGGFYNNLKQLGDEAGGYHQLNVKTGIDIDQISIDLYVNNLTDADEISWQDTVLSVDRRAVILRPRTIGIDLSYSF